jgi:hypothetical protein
MSTRASTPTLGPIEEGRVMVHLPQRDIRITHLEVNPNSGYEMTQTEVYQDRSCSPELIPPPGHLVLHTVGGGLHRITGDRNLLSSLFVWMAHQGGTFQVLLYQNDLLVGEYHANYRCIVYYQRKEGTVRIKDLYCDCVYEIAYPFPLQRPVAS